MLETHASNTDAQRYVHVSENVLHIYIYIYRERDVYIYIYIYIYIQRERETDRQRQSFSARAFLGQDTSGSESECPEGIVENGKGRAHKGRSSYIA